MRIPEGLLEPAVELVLIGEDGRFRLGPLGPVDGHAVLGLPAVAGARVAAEVGGDLLPGAEQVVLGHLAHGAPGIPYSMTLPGPVKGRAARPATRSSLAPVSASAKNRS